MERFQCQSHTWKQNLRGWSGRRQVFITMSLCLPSAWPVMLQLGHRYYIIPTDWDWALHRVSTQQHILSHAHSVLRLTAGRPNTTNTLASHIQSTFCCTSPTSTSCLQFTLSFHSNRKMAILWREVGILAIVSHTRSLQCIQTLCSEFLVQIWLYFSRLFKTACCLLCVTGQ